MAVLLLLGVSALCPLRLLLHVLLLGGGLCGLPLRLALADAVQASAALRPRVAARHICPRAVACTVQQKCVDVRLAYLWQRNANMRLYR